MAQNPDEHNCPDCNVPLVLVRIPIDDVVRAECAVCKTSVTIGIDELVSGFTIGFTIPSQAEVIFWLVQKFNTAIEAKRVTMATIQKETHDGKEKE